MTLSPEIAALMLGLGLTTGAAILAPLGARWLEHSFADPDAFLVPSLVGCVLTVFHAGGFAAIVQAVLLVDGIYSYSIGAFGAVGGLTSAAVFWRILRSPNTSPGKIGSGVGGIAASSGL